MVAVQSRKTFHDWSSIQNGAVFTSREPGVEADPVISTNCEILAADASSRYRTESVPM